MDDIKISVTPLSEWDLESLKQVWLDIYSKSRPNVFLSWNWIGSWLGTLPSLSQGRVVMMTKDEPIAIGVFFEHRVLRHGFIKSTQWLLNRTGDATLDQIWIEHNDVLFCRDYEQTIELKRLLWSHLFSLNVADEFVVNVATQKQYEWASNLADARYSIINDPQLGYAVDLNTLTDDYPRTHSPSTFKQIEKTQRLIEQTGTLEVEVTSDSSRVNELIEQCKHWHIDKWSNTPTPSGFENPYFMQFHSALMTTKQVSVVALKHKQEVVGLNYLLLDNSNVYFYLSCIKPQKDNKIKIGLLLHKLSVIWSKNEQHNCYDFLAGEQSYKNKMSSQVVEFGNITFQRNAWKFRLEHWLRNCKMKLLGNT